MRRPLREAGAEAESFAARAKLGRGLGKAAVVATLGTAAAGAVVATWVGRNEHGAVEEEKGRG